MTDEQTVIFHGVTVGIWRPPKATATEAERVSHALSTLSDWLETYRHDRPFQAFNRTALDDERDLLARVAGFADLSVEQLRQGLDEAQATIQAVRAGRRFGMSGPFPS